MVSTGYFICSAISIVQTTEMRFSHWRGLHDFCAFPVLMALQMTPPPGILMTRCSQPCCFQPLKVKTPTNRGSAKLLCMTLSPGSSLCSRVSKVTGRRECYYNCSWRKHEATHPKDKFWQLVLLTAALLALYSVPYEGCPFKTRTIRELSSKGNNEKKKNKS